MSSIIDIEKHIKNTMPNPDLVNNLESNMF